MAKLLIPRYIALGKEKKYLRYVLEEGELHSRMQLISNEIMCEKSFITKLEIVRAQTICSEEEALVHIRSCYNNKFLVLSNDENWIVAGSDEPEEDCSELSCTLFRLGGNRKGGLRLFLQSDGAEHGVQIDSEENCLIVARNSRSATDFSVTDLAVVATLPKPNQVAYNVNGDNNRYLATRNILVHKKLGFNSSDKLNQENFMLPNTNGRLKSLTYNRFWRKAGNDFIWCETNDDQTRHSKGLDHAIALKNDIRSIQKSNCYNDARIYDVKTASNLSQTKMVEKQLQFTYYKMSGSETFIPSQVKLCIIETKATDYALVQPGRIGLDTDDYQGSVQWSETKETTEEISSFVTIRVPPMTKVEVTMVIGRASTTALLCKL